MTYTLPPTRSGVTIGRIFRWTVLLAFVALVYWWMEPGPVKEVVKWRSSLTAAMAEAQQSHKLIFADFGATWCPPCQQVRRNLWTDTGVAKALDAFVPVEVDVDHDPAVAARYQINPIPAFLLIDADGHVVRRSEGAMDKSEFLGWLRH